MKGVPEERCQDIGLWLVEHKATVRVAAAHFGLSKSTVYKDVAERLPLVNTSLSKLVRQQLNINFRERNVRGGRALASKWERYRETGIFT